MSQKKLKIVIVGGVAGGAAFAARFRRLNESAEIVMLERGEFISFANCGLPYYAGDVIKKRSSLLVQTPENFRKRFNVDVRTLHEVLQIDRNKKEIKVKDHILNRSYRECYDYLILSPGAAPIIPAFEGTKLACVHTVRTVPDIDEIRKKIDQGNVKRATIIGAGFIGIEMAENFVERGVKTTIIERLDQVMAPFDKEMATHLHREIRTKGVDLLLKEEVTKISSTAEESLVHTASGKIIPADLVIMSIGVRAETNLAKDAGLTLGSRGIMVDEKMQTSDPAIFAVGDAVETLDPITKTLRPVPLAGPAAKQALVAANTIMNIEASYKGTLGTSIVKVFDLTAAATGANEKTLKQAGRKFEKIYTYPANHAGYYPGASQMSIKLLFCPEKGTVLGAQVIGRKGVDKRLDVLAVAVQHSLTVKDIAELELSYAPPYGSAKDPVNLAGMAALNHMQKLSPLIHWEQVDDKYRILDVRTDQEIAMGALPRAIQIPVDELRSRIKELPKNEKIGVSCQVGVRAHLATRLLRQSGFDAYNISGGYLAYKIWRETFFDEIAVPIPEQSRESFCSAPTGTGTRQSIDITDISKEVDARGFQCPGPIMQTKQALDVCDEGDIIKVLSSDIGFASDIPSWCKSTGNTLIKLNQLEDHVEAYILKGRATQEDKKATAKASTIVVFSDDLDKVLAAMVIARSAKAAGREVTLFFTFWGLNAIKKSNVSAPKDFLSKMFGMMMPKSIKGLKLSKMNMGGMGTSMMRYVMGSKNVESAEDMLNAALREGVKMVACSMSMDVMGIKKEELLDGVSIGGAAMYMAAAEEANHNLFI